MGKKSYQKPSMKVFEIKVNQKLLAGSDYNNDVGYVPNMNMNKEENEIA